MPNLVNTVKGEAKFEQDTLTQVVEARAKATSTTDPARASQPRRTLPRIFLVLPSCCSLFAAALLGGMDAVFSDLHPNRREAAVVIAP